MLLKPIDLIVSPGSSVVVVIPKIQLFKGCVNTLCFALTRPNFEELKTAFGTEQAYIKNGVDGTVYALEDSAGDIMYADKLIVGYEYRIKFGNNGPGGVAHFLNLNTPCCARGYAPTGFIVEED